MKKNYLSALFLCSSLGLSYAQVTEVYFKYDEAGNQRYGDLNPLLSKFLNRQKQPD